MRFTKLSNKTWSKRVCEARRLRKVRFHESAGRELRTREASQKEAEPFTRERRPLQPAPSVPPPRAGGGGCKGAALPPLGDAALSPHFLKTTPRPYKYALFPQVVFA